MSTKLSARAQALLDKRNAEAQSAHESDLLATLVREAHTPSDGKAAAQPAAATLPQPAASISAVVLPEPSFPLAAAVAKGGLAPVGRAGYTHQAMVDLMADNPDYTHAMLAAHFNRPASWLASVLASESFQQCLDSRRHEIADPSLTATLHERFKALAIRTSNVMMTKMDAAEVTDFMVLKSGEIAIKALGMGQRNSEQPQAATTAAPATDTLAERLLAMMDKREQSHTIDGDVTEVSPDGNI